MEEAKNNLPKTKPRNPITINFTLEHFEYNMHYIESQTCIKSTYIPREITNGDGFIEMLERMRSIKFTSLQSLVDYCKETNKSNLLLIFQWINLLIYKEDFKFLFDLNSNKINKQIFGFCNLLDNFIENDKEETVAVNGLKYFYSDMRAKIIKSLVYLASNIDLFGCCDDLTNLMRKFTLNVLNLNFEDSFKNIKEALLSKDKSNEVSAHIKIIEETMKCYLIPNNSFNNFNDTIKNILGDIKKIDSIPELFYVILFLQNRLDANKIIEFMSNNKISIIFKLIFIFKYTPKQDIKSYFDIIIQDCVNNGKIEGLIISGNTNSTLKILEKYMDKSDDLLVTYFLAKFYIEHKEKFYKSCENELFECLNRLKMFNQRIFMNQKLNEIHSIIIAKTGNTSQQQTKKYQNEVLEFVLNCFYCNIKIQADKADQFKCLMVSNKEPNELIDFCPKCLKKLPACAICLCPIEIIPPVNRSRGLSQNSSLADLKKEKLIDEHHDLKYIWCTLCRHGGHIDHIKEWFVELMVCPVADCSCMCLEYNHFLI